MATHHGKEGVVHVGGTNIGNATGFTSETTHDVVEDTALGSSMKSYLVGRGTFTAPIDMNFDETDSWSNNIRFKAQVLVLSSCQKEVIWR